MPKVSPLAPTRFPALPDIAGVRLAAAAAGLRYVGRTDVLLAVLDKGTTVAGVLTQSRCPSAPVEWCRARLSAGTARGLVVNSGNANAFTGKSGRAAVKLTADIAAKLGDTIVSINGIAKGSGMIGIDMATMLAFVFTDAPIAAPALQALLKEEVVDTFNAV